MRRFLLLAVLVVGGCVLETSSPGQACTMGNCAGCCRDGVCHEGMAADACGNDGVSCKSCVGSEACTYSKSYDVAFCFASTLGGGTTSGGSGASGGTETVVASIQYEYAYMGGGSCPNYEYEIRSCSRTATVRKSSFDVFRSEYPNCTVSGYTITCSQCSWVTLSCHDGYTYRNYDRAQCSTPKYAGSESCSWSPPY